MNINIPKGAKEIIHKLQSAGFEAYVVGGCVRDSLIGIEPHDWDICTSANPDEVISVLSSYKIIPTGLKHGTVTVVSQDNVTDVKLVGYEVTTFRKDGEYKDNRHPNSVKFVKSLKEDLKRRDFKMNALAYSDSTGVVDFFGGIDDIRNKTISCVGNPDDRFSEDALRIMRAMRFSSTYGFAISEETSKAIHKNKALLGNISVERIQTELVRILLGKNNLHILKKYSDVIAQIIPEIAPCIGFSQNNPYHIYSVYDHIAHAVSNYHGNDISVKMALLLHDIGKPQCYTEDERGGHFHGHSVPSYEISKQVLNRLRFDCKTQTEVAELVLYHDSVIEPTEKVVKRWLNKIGESRFTQLLEVRMADILAHAPNTQQSRINRCNKLKEIFCSVIEKEQCFSLKDLAISGNDIISLGFAEGKIIGIILDSLLQSVINEEIANEHDILVEKAKTWLDKPEKEKK